MDRVRPQQNRLRKALQQVVERYDFCVVDNAPDINILIQFCKQQEISEDGTCSRCILYNNCPATTDCVPEEWEEIHYPRMTSNTTIEYLKDGKVQLITYGRSEDAEKAFKEMTTK